MASPPSIPPMIAAVFDLLCGDERHERRVIDRKCQYPCE